MGLFSNITGVISNLFKIGKDESLAVKNNSGIAEFRNGADNAYAVLRAKELQSGFGLNDTVTALDAKGIVPLVEFSFTGASAPAGGANSNKFGFCHTAGGSYSTGDVVYDNGTALVKVVLVSGVMTTTAITGTISLVANGMYAKEGSSYVLKGDGTGATTGVQRVIALPLVFGSSATVDSSTSLPNGTVVNRVEVAVSQAFNGTSPTLAVVVNGSTPLTVMATTDNNLKTANQYETLEVKTVGATNAGVVRLNYTASSSSAGAATVYVFYATPLS